MKREWIQNIRDSLCIVLNHLLFVAGAITVFDLFEAEHSYVFLWSVAVCIPFILYHVIPQSPKLIPPPMFVILLGGMSLVEKIMATHDWGVYYYVITFVYIIGYFVYYFIQQFLQFLQLNQNTASNIPIQDIFRNGIGLTVLFSVCSSVILLLSANIDWFKSIMDRIWAGIQAVLYFLFSGLDAYAQPQGKPTVPEMKPELGDVEAGEIVLEQNSDLFRNIILVVGFVAVVMGIVFVGYYLYYLIKDFEGLNRKKKGKEILPENDDVREYCGIEKKSQRKTSGFVLRNNREKIRRIYQKRVLKKRKEIIGEQEQQQLKYLTAKECCDRLSEQQLKLVYEKARYSEEVISAEDVRLAK